MYKCRPECNTKAAFLTVAVSIIVCSACFIVSVCVESYGGLIQLGGVVLLTAAIFAISRFVLTDMEYTLTNDNFSAAKVWSNRSQGVCRLDLDTAVALVDKQTFKAEYAKKVNIKYNCCRNIGAKSYFYICEFNGKLASIEFEPNAPFLKIMSDIVEQKLAMRDSERTPD